MQIKELPVNERPIEKLLYSGISSLSTAELIALIIRTGNRNKSAIQLAEDVLSHTSGYNGTLGTADVRELTDIDGIGLSKASSIVAGFELAKRINASERMRMRPAVRESSDAAELIADELRGEKREFFVELILNVKGEVEAKEIISIGELASATVHPREVLRPAIRKSAASIIVAHNHPSGDPTPSDEDIAVTERLGKACDIVGIRLLDHIVIGRNGFVSLRAEGLLR